MPLTSQIPHLRLNYFHKGFLFTRYGKKRYFEELFVYHFITWNWVVKYSWLYPSTFMRRRTLWNGLKVIFNAGAEYPSLKIKDYCQPYTNSTIINLSLGQCLTNSLKIYWILVCVAYMHGRTRISIHLSRWRGD